MMKDVLASVVRTAWKVLPCKKEGGDDTIGGGTSRSGWDLALRVDFLAISVKDGPSRLGFFLVSTIR